MIVQRQVDIFNRAERLVLNGATVGVCHQNNVVTNNVKGFAKEVFRRYPEANIKKNKDNLGNFSRHDFGAVSIINLYTQSNVGKNHFNEPRLDWFRLSLYRLGRDLQDNPLDYLLFPYGIGCGLAGGDWFKYNEVILGFSDYYGINVEICKKV